MSTDASIASLEASVASLQAQLVSIHQHTVSKDSADTFWLLISGILVFFMQCGFAMLEAGAVASKSTESIMLKNLFDAAVAGLLWWLIGHGIFTEGGNAFFGVTPIGNRTRSVFATHDHMFNSEVKGVDWALVFFQFTYAATSSTIVSGALAERTQVTAYIVFSSIVTGLVYPVIAHWVWSTTGWLSCSNPNSSRCMIDFAGSGVVHCTGGLCALIGATIVGPRSGRFDSSGRTVPMPGHSSVLQVLGTFILWVGWYGFNCGSTASISTEEDPRIAGRVAITTTLSACVGGITCVCLEKAFNATRQWDVCSMCNGILCGLVSITAGCATVQPWAAIIIGFVGGWVYRGTSRFVRRVQVDDPLDASAVHFSCGLWGIFACAIFSTPEYAHEVTMGRAVDGGLIYGGTELIGSVCLFVLAHVAWVGTLASIIFLTLNCFGLLRVPLQLEVKGFHEDSQGIEMSTHGGQPCWPPLHTAETGPVGPPISYDPYAAPRSIASV